MHVHIGLMEFVQFTAFYIILKAILLVIHLELRQRHIKTPAAVSGLLA